MISGDLCAVLTQFLAKPTRALNLYIIQLNRFLYTTHCTSLQVCFSWAVLDYCPEQGLEYKSQSNGLKPSLAICHGLHLQITSNRKVTVFEDSRHWKWGSSPCLKSQVFGARRSSARSPGGFLQGPDAWQQVTQYDVKWSSKKWHNWVTEGWTWLSQQLWITLSLCSLPVVIASFEPLIGIGKRSSRPCQ